MANKTIALFLALIASLHSGGTSPARGADAVRLQLNWVPEPEFGGLYAAAADGGAFAKYGLNVKITPGGAGAPTWQLVAQGKADYAVASADEVLIARQQGADVVAIFATYQTCPQGLMAHASLRLKSIADVFTSGKVKQLAVEPGLPYVQFLKDKFTFDRVGKVVAYDGGIGMFLNNESLAQQCFATSEPLAAAKQGATPAVFLIADAGYNPYTAVVITRGEMAKSHAEQVTRIAAALREGWQAYLDDPKPANRAMAKLNADMDDDTFDKAAAAQRPLIETTETKSAGLGTMTLERWQTLAKQLKDLKATDGSVDAASCFVKP